MAGGDPLPKQLAPFTRIPLSTIDMSRSWVFFDWRTGRKLSPFSNQRRKWARNVGRARRMRKRAIQK